MRDSTVLQDYALWDIPLQRQMVGMLVEDGHGDSVSALAQSIFDRVKCKVNNSALDKAYQVCVYIASQYVNDIPLDPQ